MADTCLFIDGENFIYKLETVMHQKGIKKDTVNLATINFHKLFEKPLKNLHITRKIYYAAKLHFYEGTKKKSLELIKFQRKLRNTLINQGFEFILAGNVRGQKVGTKTIFREKGVDVRIAVDLISLACDKKLSTAVICSSDSDLQPAVTELRKRNIHVIYLGFEIKPNKGLTATTQRTILFRDAEIMDLLKKSI